MSGNIDEAIQELTKATSSGSYSLSFDSCRVHCNCPLAELLEFIKKNPSDARAYEMRGVIALLLGRTNWAIADFGRAAKLNPDLASEIERVKSQLLRP